MVLRKEMGHIYCVMGKSASGKDTIFQQLIDNKSLRLDRIVPYTTRPIRAGEIDGETYIFCDENRVNELEADGKIIELRAYNTVYGVWKYFTVDDGRIKLDNHDYIVIGTLDTYKKIREYFGKEKVLPIYIEVEDGDRLIRAIAREKNQEEPKYEEMCRRFLADSKDFSEEKLQELEIEKRFINIDLEETISNIIDFINQSR